MPNYEAVATDVFVSGVNRPCYMIIDAQSKIPQFEVSVWLLNEFNRKLSSYKVLAQRIAMFLNFCNEKGFDPFDFDNADLQYYLDGYLFQGDGDEKKQRDVSTVMQYGNSIVALYKGLYNLGFVKFELQIPKTFQNERLQRRTELVKGSRNSLDPFGLHKQVLDSVDFKTLVSYLPTKNARLKKRNELIMKVAYQTGCRAFEIVRPDNFSKRRIEAGYKKAKEKNASYFQLPILGKGHGLGKPRSIEIHVDLAAEILRYLKTFKVQGDAIFTNQKGEVLGKQEPTRIFKQCKDALIRDSDESLLGEDRLKFWNDYEQHRTFHSLRHSFATNLVHKLTRQMDSGPLYRNYDYVRQLMGHESIKTTNIYIAFEIDLHGSQNEKNQILLEDLSEFSHEKSEEFELND